MTLLEEVIALHNWKRLAALALALLLAFSLAVTAFADKADFEYKLILTDQNGRTVSNPRSLSAGSTLNIEIELTRTDTNATSYETYGLEFRLMSRGLRYNNDGASFSSGTPIKELSYTSGDSVGFAYYDMEQVGERIANPVLAGKWSYTVTDPSAINITVPVAVMYIVNDSESYEPVGNATLFLDPKGGKIVGTDVSGEYKSGTIVTLPDAEFADYTFLGWSDGAELYPAGHNYTVTGVVTLEAQWEGVVRDRQVLFEANGGTFVGGDPTGMYADGETIILPEIEREGYRFLGWSDGENTYAPGDEYVVDNSSILTAEWEPLEDLLEDEDVDYADLGEGDTPLARWFTRDDGTVDGGHVAWTVLLGLLLLGLLLWLLLWKRRWVLYSLKDGAVALSYVYKEADYAVEAVLLDGEEEYHLNFSDAVTAKHRLRFMKGSEDMDIADVEPGKYKGKLVIKDRNGKLSEEKCRIKVLDREIRERENR